MKQSIPKKMQLEHSIASNPNTGRNKGVLFAGLLAGFTASACCAGPFVLLMLGISGSWISNLQALEAFRPVFIVLAVLLLGYAYRRIYIKSSTCDVDAVCATEQGEHSQKVLFWTTTTIIVLSISFPWYGPILLD
ncbi:MAG: mercuric transporter MerT family protein [Gammaproteobacteria bacterium]|nr:mercuric transporter MerT family protein [Gammaproteobacteria bacterium]